MNRLLLGFFIFYALFEFVFNYLTSDSYRELKQIEGDFNSDHYFKYFVMNLRYFQNNPELYYHNCNEGKFFGFFRFGNITNYLSYENYGSFGINLKFIVNTEFLTVNKNDSVRFYMNDQLKGEVFFDNEEKNMGHPYSTTLCGKKVKIYDLKMLYKNERTAKYSPIEMKISSNIDTLSDAYWGISDLQYFQQECPPKCHTCDDTKCLSCGKNMVFKAGICLCSTEAEFFDFTGEFEKIDCKEKYVNVLEENYKEEYPNSPWIWNDNQVSPFNFLYNCTEVSKTVFGGPNDFGDKDTLTKFIKYNDNKIFGKYQPSGYNYNYVPISNYKVEFTVATYNWNKEFAKLSVATSSKSNPLELSLSTSEPVTCNFKESVLISESTFSYPSLSDKPFSANITLVASPMPSRKNNNFGLVNFKFLISPCHPTCQTCSTPEINACNTCSDPNAILQNGKCVCKPNFYRDTDHPLNPCVASEEIIFVSNGKVNENRTDIGSILTNHISYSSTFCEGKRSLIGGLVYKKVVGENNDVFLDFINYEMEEYFYKAKVTMELVTENDKSLSFPFQIYSSKDTQVSDFISKQLKFLKLDEDTLLPDCFTGKNQEDYFKQYKIEFYMPINQKILYLKIKNNFNKFWGVLSLKYTFLKCHSNCQSCSGYTFNDCTSCKFGTKFNPLNYNSTLKKGSCICDDSNGFIKTNQNNSTVLECQQKNTNYIKNFYLNDLDNEFFTPEIWKNNENILNMDNILSCENIKILGNINIQKYNYLERNIDLTKSIPSFSFHNFEGSFNLSFIKKLGNFVIKVFLNGNYIWGNKYTPSTMEEEIQCTQNTAYYRKKLNFTFYRNEYFQNLIDDTNPSLRIQVFPESECLYDSECGWGIDNLEIKINRDDPEIYSKCVYRPFISCPCSAYSEKCECYPGYFSSKSKWGDYSCLSCSSNCLICSGSKCSQCMYGFNLLNDVCASSPKVLKSTQTSIMQFVLANHYENSNYKYTGMSLNLWAKFEEISDQIEKPIFLVDPFLLNYNNTGSNFCLRNSNFNYMFSYSNYFPTLINYPTFAKNSNYQNTWIPFSLGLLYSEDYKNFYIQLSINNETPRSLVYNQEKIPKNVFLFNHYSKIRYRYLKMWDRFIPSEELNSINYVNDYLKVPSDLLFYMKLVEGSFKNRGQSNLIYLMNKNNFEWELDANTPPPTCSENEYWDNVRSSCGSCYKTCKHCFSGTSYGCIDCDESLPFLDAYSKKCNLICDSNKYADNKYLTNKRCLKSCPSDCEKCDNINGCILCKKGYILYNNYCVKKCTPKMAVEIPYECSHKYNDVCKPSLKIKNKIDYFFIDGTDFNMVVDLIDCDKPLNIKWKTSLTNEIYKYNNKSLFISADHINIPKNHTIEVVLLNENNTEILSSDYANIEFMTYSINGGKISSFYMNDTMTFTLEKFNKDIAPSYNGKIQYTWTCPKFITFSYCNVRMNKPTITFDLKNTDMQYFKSDVLFDIQVKVISNSVNKATFVGFFVVYKQNSFPNYFNFSLFNSTPIAYGHDVTFKMHFENPLRPTVIKNNILINWKINSTQIVPRNGHDLPDFLVNFSDGYFGDFNITCSITYRNGTFAEKKLSKSILFNIPNPPQIGTFESYPDYLVTLSNKQLMLVANKFISEEDPTGKSFKYSYYYRNIFGEYVKIINRNDYSNQANFIYVPITDSVQVGVNFKGESMVYKSKDIKVTLNTVLNYNKIIEILEFEVENAILQLEAYSINLRFHSKSIEIGNKNALMIINKLKNVIEKNTDNVNLNTIVNNLDKIGSILEASSYKLSDYNTNSDLINQILSKLFNITEAVDHYNSFNTEKSNNFLRFYDNLLNLNKEENTLSNTNFKIITKFKELVIHSFMGITKGNMKLAHLKKIIIVGFLIDYKFLKTDIFYETKENHIGQNIKNPIFYEDYSFIYNKNYVIKDNYKQISTRIPRLIVDLFENDFIVLIKQYKNWNKFNYTGNSGSNEWFALTTDMIDVSFIEEIKIVNKTGFKLFNYNETFNIKTDSETVIINFPYTIGKEMDNFGILNFTSCVKLTEKDDKFDPITGILEDKCNTWFDYKNKYIQCECDEIGIFTVAFNKKYLYKRKSIQFPQTEDSIANPWGLGTMGFMLLLLIICVFILIKKDKKELAYFSVPSNRKKYYDEIRKKLNESSSAIKEMTFGNLYSRIFKISNDFYNIMNFRDFYFLRSHRFLMMLLRFYMVIVISFFNQQIILTFEVLQQVELRDIRIKPDRKSIYIWNPDWLKEILNNIILAIPIGLIMFICPRLSEWVFQYDESVLRFHDNSNVITSLGEKYFKFKLSQIKTNYEENKEIINKCLNKKEIRNNNYKQDENKDQVIELQDFGNNNNAEVSEDKSFEYLVAYRRCRAFVNFNKMINMISLDVRMNLFVNEKHDELPEDLTPLYSKRLLKQVENYEIRMFDIRAKLHTDQTKKVKEQKYELLKNREKLMKDFKDFIEEKDIDQKALTNKLGYFDYKNLRRIQELKDIEEDEEEKSFINENQKENENKEIGSNRPINKSEVLKSNSSNSNKKELMNEKDKEDQERNEEEKENKKENEKEENESEEEEEEEEEIEETQATILVDNEQSKYAFIPYLVSRIKKVKIGLILKITLIIIILLSLTYITSANITVLKNQGGNKKAIFWVIMVSISITFNYLIFLPLICLVKTKILLKYGPFHPRKFSFNIKNLLFLFFITETDRAIFKELKETIKNNNTQEEKIMTSFFGFDDDNNFLKTINSSNDENENKDEEKDQLLDKKSKRNEQEEIISKKNESVKEMKSSKKIESNNEEVNRLNIDEIQFQENQQNENNEIKSIKKEENKEKEESRKNSIQNEQPLNSNENNLNNSDFIFEEENPVNMNNYTKNNISSNLDFSKVSHHKDSLSNKKSEIFNKNENKNNKKNDDDDINFTD